MSPGEFLGYYFGAEEETDENKGNGENQDPTEESNDRDKDDPEDEGVRMLVPCAFTLVYSRSQLLHLYFGN